MISPWLNESIIIFLEIIFYSIGITIIDYPGLIIMRKVYFFIIFSLILTLFTGLNAEESVMFAAAPSGINVRSEPNIKSRSLGLLIRKSRNLLRKGNLNVFSQIKMVNFI